jgi:pectinesterase
MSGKLALVAGVALALTGLSAAPAAADVQHDFVVVAADGSGDFSTVQAAVDAAPAGSTTRFTIAIKPGTYNGQVIVPNTKPHLAFVGLTPDPRRVVIADDRANGTPKPGGGTWGTTGSASVTIAADDFLALNLTFANTFDEAAHPEFTGHQAVAVKTTGDRNVFERVRFLGNQDTLYVDSRNVDTVARAYFHDCYVEGDVDFIFGRGTAVFDLCRIHSLDRASTTNNGYVTAASTSIANPHGFLFLHDALTGDAPAGTVSLGRPWHPSNDPNAIAQVTIRDSFLGDHINPTPWTDFGTFSWRDARYGEFRDIGPGAGPAGADRPTLTREQAHEATPAAYLEGTDGWHPFRFDVSLSPA